jgi:hemolysin III
MLLVADSPLEYVGAAIFGASLMLVYWTSAAYHLIKGPPLTRTIVGRLDDCMVLLLIGGTYTPFCLLVLSLPWGISMLAVVWAIAGLGILINLARPVRPHWFRLAFYASLGWLALVPAAELAESLTDGQLMLLALGGVMYTLGGVTFVIGRPNPWPQTFGYLEVFHVFVIAGSALHYWLVTAYVL